MIEMITKDEIEYIFNFSENKNKSGIQSIRQRALYGLQPDEFTSIPDEKKRARAERIVITLAKDYIMNRETSFRCGADYRKAIQKAIAKF